MITALTQLIIGISVSLAWDASPSPEVDSYNVYIGSASRTYTQKFEVGNFLTYGVRSLTPEKEYFFTATALNLIGVESEYSNEVSYTPDKRDLLLALNQDGMLSAQVFDGGQFEIEQAKDLSSGIWTPFGSFLATNDVSVVQVPLDGEMNFFRLKKLSDATPRGFSILTPSGTQNLNITPDAVTAVPGATQIVEVRARAESAMPAPMPPTLGIPLREKIKTIFRYRGAHPVDERKGAEKLMEYKK